MQRLSIYDSFFHRCMVTPMQLSHNPKKVLVLLQFIGYGIIFALLDPKAYLLWVKLKRYTMLGKLLTMATNEFI